MVAIFCACHKNRRGAFHILELVIVPVPSIGDAIASPELPLPLLPVVAPVAPILVAVVVAVPAEPMLLGLVDASYIGLPVCVENSTLGVLIAVPVGLYHFAGGELVPARAHPDTCPVFALEDVSVLVFHH